MVSMCTAKIRTFEKVLIYQENVWTKVEKCVQTKQKNNYKNSHLIPYDEQGGMFCNATVYGIRKRRKCECDSEKWNGNETD